MVTLNEAYVFARDAPPDARMAFSSGPKKTLFNPGVEFLRFITAENKRTGDKGNQIFGSPWWFSKQTFRRLVAHADPKGLGIGDVARIQLAVPKEFNARMEWICLIYLTHPVYGWCGKAARQLAAAPAQDNPLNPDPSKPVRWGEPSDEEMMGFWLQFADPQPVMEKAVAAQK